MKEMKHTHLMIWSSLTKASGNNGSAEKQEKEITYTDGQFSSVFVIVAKWVCTDIEVYRKRPTSDSFRKPHTHTIPSVCISGVVRFWFARVNTFCRILNSKI